MTEDNNGWNVWQRAVLGDLKELKESTKKQTEITTSLLISMATLKKELKMKSGLWGAIGGLLPILLGLCIYLIKVVI